MSSLRRRTLEIASGFFETGVHGVRSDIKRTLRTKIRTISSAAERGKNRSKNWPHHGDPEQHAEDAVARDREVGLDRKLAQVDQVEGEAKLDACKREP